MIKTLIQRFSSSRLALDSAIVFSGTMVANIGSYLYHLLIGRFLGPVVYGEVSSLFSLLYVFTVPILVGQTVLIKYVSTLKANGTYGQAKSLFMSTTTLFIAGLLLCIPLVIFFSDYVSEFLHLTDKMSFILLYVLLATTLISIPAISLTQGYQKFIWFSLFTATVILLKLFFSLPLVIWGVNGMLWAAILAAGIIYILYFIPIRFILRAQAEPFRFSRKEVLRFTVPTLLTLLGITSLYSTDIMLVRHFFPPEAAGMYAALAVLGKIIFFASSAIIQVSFPVLSEQSALKKVSGKLVLSAISGVSIISLILVVIYFLIPNIIIGLLFGDAYRDAAGFLGLFGIFLALFSLGNITAVICLAIGKTMIYILPGLLAILQILLINLFHRSINDVILINIFVSLLFAFGSVLFLYFQKNEKI